MKQLEKYIIAVYYFKADLLGENKYIEPVGAIGPFSDEESWFQYTEAKRLLPVHLCGKNKDDSIAFTHIFYSESDPVRNAYYIDAKNKTAYTTNFPLDSLQQFDLSRFKKPDIALTPMPDSILVSKNYYCPESERIPTTFDILKIGRVCGAMLITSFEW